MSISPADLIRLIFQSYDSKNKVPRDIVADLNYDGFHMVMIIVVKIDKIARSDDASISAAHEQNLVKARKQAGLYVAKDATKDFIQRVVVSGVWHPRLNEVEAIIHYKLNLLYKFM